jgi:hypothetical protein
VGKKVLFEGNAVVWAEEPASITGLWKQRLRWARGNVQVSLRYRWIWFRRDRHRKLGGASFGLFWFTIFLMPVFMIAASIGLVSLFFVDFPLSWALFRLLWITNAVTYLFVTFFSLTIDGETARRTWKEGLMFPGLVSLVIIVYTCFPPLFERYLSSGLESLGVTVDGWLVKSAILFAYAWLAGSMVVAWLAKRVEGNERLGRLSPTLVYTSGYGPLLCAITFASYILELRGAELKWDKTEKTGKLEAVS